VAAAAATAGAARHPGSTQQHGVGGGGASRPLRIPGGQAAPSGYDPGVPRHHITELPSGLRIASERLPGVRSVAVGFWIGSGSRDETPRKAGISHFIEHLLFKGTQRYDALEIAEIFDALGGELNAATSREHVVVYARVPDEQLETAVRVMAEMVFAPRFAELETEREVVLEEIAMVEDAPQDLVHDSFGEALFGGHPLGTPVIGTAEVISSVSRQTIRAHHRAAYAPGNVVISAAGNVRHEEFAALIGRCLPELPAGPAPSLRRSALVATPPPSLRFQRKDTEQYHVCVGAPGISRTDERRFALSLFDTILGGSASSRLFQEIREKRGMAYSVFSFSSQYQESGQLGVYVGTREENVATCLEIVAEQIGELAEGRITAAELERAKANVRGRILLALESTSSRMSRLGKALVVGSELLPATTVIKRIERVQADELAAIASELLGPARLSAAGIGPDEGVFRAAVDAVNPGLRRAA
jgi:predicted Zn-dependent peptidase